MEIRQTAPFTIQVEPTEGCNLGCKFCGLQGMRKNGTKPWKFMTTAIAERIASEIARVGWKAKIVFAVHGEPTLNPDLLEIIKIFRSHLEGNIFHLYTNGININKSENPGLYLDKLFDAGVDDVLIDCYTKDSYAFIEKVGDRNVVVLEPGVPYYTTKHERRILLVPPLDDDKVNRATRRLLNHAGAAAPLDKSFNNKRCALPFREMTIRWDGNVALCCNDFRGAYKIANIMELPIDELWQHPLFQAARIMLYNKDRNFVPCDGCNTVSLRVGFLPDPTGKEELPSITPKIRKTAESVFKKNGYLSDIVKREWEE